MFSDPYGNAFGALPDNSDGNLDNAYLGQYQRPTEHEAGVEILIEMGARGYSPITGRFLEVDPAESGATFSDYAYVADPVNFSDLNGKWCVPILGRIIDKRPGHPKECPGAKAATEILTDVAVGIPGADAAAAFAGCEALTGGEGFFTCARFAGGVGSAIATQIKPLQKVARWAGKTAWTAGRGYVQCLQGTAPGEGGCYGIFDMRPGQPVSNIVSSGRTPIRGAY
jgi:RHS repeat-associated protein